MRDEESVEMKASKKYRGLRLALGASLALLAVAPLAHAEKKEFKYTVGTGAMVAIVNQKGAITVHPSAGRQVIITANPASDKMEAYASQTGNRISVRSRMVGKASGDEARVDYDVQVPADVNLSIGSGSGEVKIDNLRANITVDAEEGQVTINGASGGIVQVQSLNATVTLSNVKGRVQLATSGGAIQLNNVSGPSVTAKSTTGAITFAGDFGGGGNYLLTNHSGDIGVSLPATASVDLTARSIQGSVENEFTTLQKPAHVAFPVKEGKSLAGVLNAGSSSVELRSFSGKIRVKKQ